MRRTAQLAVVAVVLLGLAGPSSAKHKGKTQPISGAVSLPGGFNIGSPFEKGEKVQITAGYSPSGGSSYHKRTNDSSYANDYYALDMILPDYGDHGKGEPVVAIAGGTVRKAGAATQGWSTYGLRVYIEHDYNADGHTYISLYAHMNSLAVSPGDHVDKGEKIGTLGGSCYKNGGVVKGCWGSHIHFALHRDSNIGGSGTGGSYGGNAVVPEPMDGVTGLHSGTTFTSKNGGGTSCACSTSGKTETKSCGDCGERTRSCDGCNWSDWSSCQNEGVCSAGATETQTCRQDGTRERTCRQNCSWGGWSSCEGYSTDPDTGTVRRDTGYTPPDAAARPRYDTGGGDNPQIGPAPTGNPGGAPHDAGPGSSGAGSKANGGSVQTSSCSAVGGSPVGGRAVVAFALLLVAGFGRRAVG